MHIASPTLTQVHLMGMLYLVSVLCFLFLHPTLHLSNRCCVETCCSSSRSYTVQLLYCTNTTVQILYSTNTVQFKYCTVTILYSKKKVYSTNTEPFPFSDQRTGLHHHVSLHHHTQVLAHFHDYSYIMGRQ